MGTQTLTCRIRGELPQWGYDGGHELPRQASNLEHGRFSSTVRPADNPHGLSDVTSSILTRVLRLLLAETICKAAARAELSPGAG